MLFFYHNLKIYKMIEMHSKYDNMHTNRIFNTLNCINNHVNLCMNCMLSTTPNISSENIVGSFPLFSISLLVKSCLTIVRI